MLSKKDCAFHLLNRNNMLDLIALHTLNITPGYEQYTHHNSVELNSIK